MPRNLTTAVKNALVAETVYPAHLAEVTFGSTTLYLWDGNTPLSWNGNTYLGNGWFLDYTPTQETEDLRAEGFVIRLSSVPDEVMAYVPLAQQNSFGRVLLAMLSSNGVVIADPFELCGGELDSYETTEGRSGAILTLNYESDLLELRKPKELRYTEQFQRSLFPGDAGFNHVATLQNKRVNWLGPSDIPSAQRT